MSLPRKCMVTNIPSLSGLWRSLINLLDTLNNAGSLVKLTLHLKELRHDSVVRGAKVTHVAIDSADSPHNAFKCTPERAEFSPNGRLHLVTACRKITDLSLDAINDPIHNCRSRFILFNM